MNRNTVLTGTGKAGIGLLTAFIDGYGLISQLTIFQSCWDVAITFSGTSTIKGSLECLADGHHAADVVIELRTTCSRNHLASMLH